MAGPGRPMYILSVSSKSPISFQETKPTAISNQSLRTTGSDVLRARVISQLDALKRVLQGTKIEDKSDVSQLEALDPQGTYWPAFKEHVGSTLDLRLSESWTPEQKRLHKQLLATKAAGSEVSYLEIRTALHYAFVDYVLSKDQPKPSGAVAHTSDLRYPTEWYTGARANQREIHLHVGPTNSGKTYNALKRLEESKNGFYAGPLRLLAHEVFSRFKARGIPCDLITGDDVRLDESQEAKLYASTVEMVDVNRPVDVAVIDEIQMMASEDRGWAWTRAFLGANAKEIHLCGEMRVIPLIRELAASMGDTLHVHQYERLNPLKAMSRSLRGNLKNLRKGDCIVSFSVMGIHALKKQIELDTGRRVAIVYGSLPPETRAQQAAFFNDPDNDYDFLVASDAIGMGLNLSVKRIIFETLHKFNGSFKEQLSVPQIKQIAGRAGRYRSAHQDMHTTESDQSPEKKRATEYQTTATVGLVTCLDEADLPLIQEALRTESPPIKAAGILPPADFIEEFAARLPKGLPFEYIMQRLCDAATLHPRFILCNIRDQLRIAKAIGRIQGLSIGQMCTLTAAPADPRTTEMNLVLVGLAKCIAAQKSFSVTDIPEIPLEVLDQPMSAEREYLQSLETLHKSLILFLWLSYRFIHIFKDQEMAFHAKTLVEEKINTTLLEFSANPQLRKRLLMLKQQSALSKSMTVADGQVASVDAGREGSGMGDPTNLLLDWGRGPAEPTFAPDELDQTQAARVLE